MSSPNVARAILFALTAGTSCLAAGQPVFVPSVYVGEFYSNADGTVQFVMLGSAATATNLAGRTLVVSSGSEQHVYTFPTNLPDVGGRRNGRFLAATQTFADLYSLTPDFILPDNFVFTRGVRLSVDLVTSGEPVDVPTDGTHSLYVDYESNDWENITRAGPAIAFNHAGHTVSLAPMDVIDQIEYYNAELDDYFLTSYPQEIDALDTGAIAGWQRTGQRLSTFTGTPVDLAVFPGMGPVCRVYAAGAHFYALVGEPDPLAAGNTECVSVPRADVETWNAFYATEPNLTGLCPEGQAQTQVYRVWNPRGAGHRYTTQTSIRDEMLAQGYVAEGYGPDKVVMCVAAGAQTQ